MMSDFARGNGSRLAGLRVLLVEDETLISLLAEDMLAELGCVVAGPAPRVAVALDIIAQDRDIEAAVLDVNVADERIFPVAEILARRGIPFVFATGFGAGGVPETWRDRPVIQKPYTVSQLATALTAAVMHSHRSKSTERSGGGVGTVSPDSTFQSRLTDGRTHHDK